MNTHLTQSKSSPLQYPVTNGQVLLNLFRD